jgi:chlorite dismutase
MGLQMETGLAVVHLFGRTERIFDREGVKRAIEHAREAGLDVVVASILGHKADVCILALGPDIEAIRTLQSGVQHAGVDVVDSYVSITEVSEYAAGAPEAMLQARLYPKFPVEGKDAFCFYPMSKKREAHANWFATPFEERRDMMMEHGTSGRKFAGQIVQLVTGSTGLDDYEWGVTLFATGFEAIKDVVYTLRFDKGSALFGEFGKFYVGYVTDVDSLP